MRYYEIVKLTEDRLESLDKYKNDPDIYISFTRFKRIGIHPDSQFSGQNSPLGIYAYPLKEIYQQLLDMSLPFSGRPYIFVIKSNVPIIDLASITSTQVDQYVKITNDYCKKNFSDVKYDTFDPEEFPHQTNIGEKFYKWLGYVCLDDLETDERGGMAIWNNILRSCGFQAIYDQNHVIGTRSEPSQVLFLSKDAVNVVDMIYNSMKNNDVPTEHEAYDINHILDYINSGDNNQQYKNLIACLSDIGKVFSGKPPKYIKVNDPESFKKSIKDNKNKILDIAEKFLDVKDIHKSTPIRDIPNQALENLKKAISYFENMVK